MVALQEDLAAAIKGQDLLDAAVAVRSAIDGVAQKHDEVGRLDGKFFQQRPQRVRLPVDVADGVDQEPLRLAEARHLPLRGGKADEACLAWHPLPQGEVSWRPTRRGFARGYALSPLLSANARTPASWPSEPSSSEREAMNLAYSAMKTLPGERRSKSSGLSRKNSR